MVALPLPLYVDVSTNATGATVSNVKIGNGFIDTFSAIGTNSRSGSYIPMGTQRFKCRKQQYNLCERRIGKRRCSELYCHSWFGRLLQQCIFIEYYYRGNAFNKFNELVGSTTVWNTASNWSNGVPNKYKSAVINGGTTNPCYHNQRDRKWNYNQRRENADHKWKQFTGSLWVISLQGGTFTPNSSTVTLYGCSGANVLSAATSINFYNLTVNNTEWCQFQRNAHRECQ